MSRRVGLIAVLAVLATLVTGIGSSEAGTAGNPDRINGALRAGAEVTEFAVTQDGSRVVYRADQDTTGVFELYSVPSRG